PGCGVAAVVGADIVVVAIDGGVHAAAPWVAGISRAGAAVVANNRGSHADTAAAVVRRGAQAAIGARGCIGLLDVRGAARARSGAILGHVAIASGGPADPRCGLELARCRATVTVDVVAVVTLLGVVHDSVAAALQLEHAPRGGRIEAGTG